MATQLDDVSPRLALRAEVERYRREIPPPDPAAPWRERIRATLYSLHRFLAADELAAWFLLVELRFAAEPVRLVAEGWMEAFFDLIDEGRGEPTAPAGLTRVTAEALGGGIYMRVYAAIVREGALPPEEEIVPELMYSVALPYCGQDAAREEFENPPAPPPAMPPEPRLLGLPRG
jgi:AcrR family transcriptional regulator